MLRNGNDREHRGRRKTLTVYATDVKDVRKTTNIISELTLAFTNGKVEYTVNIITEGLRLKVMNRDTTGTILSYLPRIELANATLGVKVMSDKVQDVHNSRYRYEFLSTQRLHKCINTLQEATEQPGENTQEATIEQGN